MECVQRRVTKFILKSNDPYDIHLMKLNLMSLEKRRLLTDVTLLYKVNNSNINIDISKILDFHSEADCFSVRSKEFLTLKKKHARTIVLKYSFFHQTIDMLNPLPFNIRYSHNVVSSVEKFISDS